MGGGDEVPPAYLPPPMRGGWTWTVELERGRIVRLSKIYMVRHHLGTRLSSVNTNAVSFVTAFLHRLRPLAKPGRFENIAKKWSIFKTIQFHLSCERWNCIDLSTVTILAQNLHCPIENVEIARTRSTCSGRLFRLISGLSSLFQLSCILLYLNEEP